VKHGNELAADALLVTPGHIREHVAHEVHGTSLLGTSGSALRTAARRPAWSSAMTRRTPDRPRSTSSRSSAAQLASDSWVPM
jgi:hypothetical protein